MNNIINKKDDIKINEIVKGKADIYKISEEFAMLQIVTLINTFKQKISDINKIYMKRNCKLNFHNMFLLLMFMNGSKVTGNQTLAYFKGKKIFNKLVPSAVSKKRAQYNPLHFKNMADTLNELFYANRGPSVIATDGTYMALKKNFIKYGYKESQNTMYSTTLINSIYDVTNQMVLDFSVCKHENERQAFYEQLPYLKKGDIILLDRGYYSESLIKNLSERKIDFVFRCPNNNLLFKGLELNETRIEERDINYGGVITKTSFRVFRYDVEKPVYRNKKQREIIIYK
jgi:DDE family transposase